MASATDADHTGADVYAYTAGGARASHRDFTGLESGGMERIVGIWSDGTTFWFADDGVDKIFAYNFATKAREAHKDITLHSGNTGVRGLWGNGSVMYVVDHADNYVYAYDMTNFDTEDPLPASSRYAAGESFDLEAGQHTQAWGIWSDGVTFYVGDTAKKQLIAYSRPNMERVVGRDRHISDVPRPTGFFVRDSALRVVSDNRDVADNSNKIYLYNWFGVDQDRNLTKVTEASINYYTERHAHAHPQGIWIDNDSYWIADNQGHGVLKYNLSDGAVQSAESICCLDTHGNTEPTGVWSDGTTMWVADTGSDKVFAYVLSSRERDAAKDIALHTGNTEPRGLWSDGVHLYVVDAGADHATVGKVFAYDIADLVTAYSSRHLRSESFSLDVDQNRAWGIWSDGVHMWVSDSSKKQLIAYRESDKARLVAMDRYVPNVPLPTGIHVESDVLYVASDEDRSDAKIHVHNWASVDGSGNVTRTRTFAPIFDAANQNKPRPQGLWQKGKGDPLYATDWLSDLVGVHNASNGDHLDNCLIRGRHLEPLRGLVRRRDALGSGLRGRPAARLHRGAGPNVPSAGLVQRHNPRAGEQ